MGKTELAIDTLDRLAVQLAGIHEAAQQLRSVGSYEGAIETLQRDKAQLEADIVHATQELANVQARSQEAIASAKDAADRMKAMASETLKEAHEKAEQLLQDAGVQAEQKVKAETERRGAALAEIQQKIEEEMVTLNATRAKIDKELARAKAVEQRVASAQQALDSIQMAIQAQAKAMAHPQS